MLEQLAENLWRLEAPVPGMPLGRVMTVARMSDGALLIHNAIDGGEALYREVAALGAPRYLVVPNGWHRLDAPKYKVRFPSIQVVAPAGGRKKVSQVVAVDLTYEELAKDDAVRMETLDGLAEAEGVLHVRSNDGVTLVFTDVVFNLPKRFPGLQGFIYHDLVGSKPGPRVTRVARWFVVKQKHAYRTHLERLAATPDLKRVIVAHGAMETNDPAAMLRAAAATL
jgi:hypothetical protein